MKHIRDVGICIVAVWLLIAAAGCSKPLTERQKFIIACDSYVATTTVLVNQIKAHPPTAERAAEIAAWDSVCTNALNQWGAMLLANPADPVAAVKKSQAQDTFNATYSKMLDERKVIEDGPPDPVKDAIIRLEIPKPGQPTTAPTTQGVNP